MTTPQIPGRDIPDPALTTATDQPAVTAPPSDAELAKTGVPAERPDDPAMLLWSAVRSTAKRQDQDRARRMFGTQPPGPLQGGGLPAVRPPVRRTRVVNGFPVWDINPAAFDPGRYNPAIPPTPEAQQLIDDIDKLTIAAQVKLGVDEPAARSIARRLNRMGADMPWVRDLINKDFQTAVGLSELDAMAARFLPEFTASDKLYRVAADMIADVRNRYSTIDEFQRATEVVKSGPFDVSTLDPQDFGEAWMYRANRPTQDIFVARNRAAGFIDKLQSSEVSTVETFFDQSADRLTATVTYVDGATVRFDVKLDPGTEITADTALEELFLATSGYSHEVTSTEGKLRGPQTLQGAGFELAGSAFRAFDKVNGPVNGIIGALINGLGRISPGTSREDYIVDWRTSANRYRDENSDLINRKVQAIRSDFGRDDMMVMIAQARLAETPEGAVLAAGTSMDFVDSLSDSDFVDLRSEMLDEDELRKVLKEQVDDRSTIKRYLDTQIQGIATVGAYYDNFLQWFGTHGFAVGGTVWDTLSTRDVKRGWEMFRDNWQQANDSQRLSDYWGWEGAGATWLDVSGSILMDPFVWVTPGGKGLAQMAIRRLATEAGAREAINLPVMQRMANMILDTVEAGDLKGLAGLTRGMDMKFRRALAQAGSLDEVSAIMLDAFPANNGMWLASFDGHVALRNTALNISEGSRIFDLAPKKWKTWFRNALGTFKQDRYVGLGPLNFVDDMEEMIFAVFRNDKDGAAKWVEKLWSTWDDFERPFETQNRAALERLAQVRDKANDTLGAIPQDVKAFGRVRDQTLKLEQRLREIDNRLGDDLVRMLDDGIPDSEIAQALPVADDAKALIKERRIITKGADRLDELKAQRVRITSKPTVDRPNGWEETVARIKAEEADLRKVGVLRMSSESDTFTEMAAKYDVYDKAKRGIVREVGKVTRHAKAALRPGNRDQLAAFADELVEAVGDRLGLERGSTVSPFTGRNLHKWEAVTGEQTWSPVVTDQIAEVSANLEAMARRADSTIDEDLLAKLKAQGSGANQGVYRLPASPMEIVAYESFADKPAWLQKVMRAPAEETKAVGRLMSTLNRWFSGSVLLNPRTIVRSGLDESIRNMIEHGILGREASRAVGVGGQFGDELARGRIEGPLRSAVDQFLPGRTKGLIGAPADLPNELSGGFQRELLRPFDRASARGYTMVAPTDKGFVDAARFWLNGFALNDEPTLRAWRAIANGDPQEFLRWWDEGGALFARTPVVKLGDGSVIPLTAQTAFEAGQNTLEYMLYRWPETIRGEARKALLDAARTGRSIPAKLLRKMNAELPGAAQTASGSLLDRVFDSTYARTSARRGSLIHQQEFADNLEILWKAKDEQGKLLTSARLAEMAGVSQEEAARWLSTASWEVEYLVDKMGMVTPRQLVEVAARRARDRTNNLMYQSGAGSILGRRFQKGFPFGPAQLDYNTYFLQRMTDTLEFGLNPTVARALATVRNPIRTIKSLVTSGARVGEDVPLGALGRTFQPSMFGAPIPFNLRLAAQVGAWLGAGSTQVKRQQQAGETRTKPEGPLALLDQITFAPTFPGENFVMDFSPGLGPVWNFAVHLLPTTKIAGDTMGDNVQNALASLRDFMGAVMPAVEFDDRQYDITNPSDFASGLFNSVIPKSTNSLRGGLEGAMLMYSALRGGNYQTTVEALNRFGRPVGWSRVWKTQVGDLFESNDFVVRDTQRANDLLGQSVSSALKLTATEGFQKTLKKWGAFGLNIDDFDGEYVKHWSGLVKEIDFVHSLGLVGDSATAKLKTLADRIENDPNAIREDFVAYADAAASIMFPLPDDIQALILVRHPGMVTNMVSGSQCRLDSGSPVGPSQYCAPDGRLRVPPGGDGRDVLKRGRSEGWIQYRPEKDQFDDMLDRLGAAHRRVSRMLWTRITGDANYRGPSTATAFPKFLREAGPVNVSEVDRKIADKLGIQLPAQVTPAELADSIAGARKSWLTNTPRFSAAHSPAVSEIAAQSLARNDTFGPELLNVLQKVEQQIANLGLEGFSETPDFIQEDVRNRFQIAIMRGLLAKEDYDRYLARVYGPIGFVTPQPPPASGLDWSFTADRDQVEVIDGDTLRVYLNDEVVRVRLIGINAQDYSSTVKAVNDEALDHRDRLETLLNQASEIRFGIWDAKKFGTIREEDPRGGATRYLLWLYLDGEAVFNPDAFTFRNPTGVAPSGAPPPKPATQEMS